VIKIVVPYREFIKIPGIFYIFFTFCLAVHHQQTIYFAYSMWIVKSTILALLVCSLLACGGSRHSHKSMPGVWQAQPINIDGNSSDWPSPYPNYDAKALVAYATSNDRDFLYITMETGDDLTQLKMLKNGMTVYIDTGGGKDLSVAIRYPLQDENNNIEVPKSDDMHSMQHGSNKTDFLSKQLSTRIKHGLEDANQYTLDGFGKCSGGYMVKQPNACGIKVSMGMDEYGELIWEAAIPFSVLYGKDHISAKEKGKVISVCWALTGLKKTDNKDKDNSMNMANSGMGSGGGMRGAMQGGGGHRGGSRGGGMGPQEDPREHLYQSTKTWKVFEIAYQ
jgi:hypothetical protein